MNRRFFISLLAAVALAPKLVRLGNAVEVPPESPETNDTLTVTSGTWTSHESKTVRCVATWEGSENEGQWSFTWKATS